MAEYIGFVAPREQLNYGELTGGIIDALKGVQQKRDTARAEMQQATDDLTSTVNSYETGKSKSMNDIMLNTAMSVKENIYNANRLLKAGQIKPSEYRAMINNTKDYWSTLSSTAKSFDQRYQEIIKRQEEGAGSKIEADLAEYYADIADLKNAIIHHDPATGKLYYAKQDENGNFTRLDDVRRLNNPGNTLFDRVDLSANVQEVVKNVGDWEVFFDKGMGGTETISDARQNPAFNNWLRNTASAFVSNDRQAASILADNAVQLDNGMTVSFNTYFDDGTNGEQRKQAKIQAAVDQYKLAFPDATEEDLKAFIDMQEKSMIRFTQDASGDWQPALTDEQRKLAYDRAVMEIEMQVPFKKDGTSKQSYNKYYGISSSRSSGSGEEEGGGDYARYAQAREGWINADSDMLTGAAQQGYKIEVKGTKPNRTVVVSKVSGKDEYNEFVYEPITEFKYDGGDLRNLSPYLYKYGTVKGREVSPQQQFDDQRKAYQSKNQNNTQVGILD